MMMMIAVIG